MKKLCSYDEFYDTSALNNRTYLHFYNRLLAIAMSMFKWDGLPETVDKRYLELTLNTNFVSVFFQDEVMGFLALPVMTGAPFSVYNIPTWRMAYAVNNYRCYLDASNSVLIYNDVLHRTDINSIELYAYRLYMLQRAIDVNVNRSKMPLIVTCTEQQKLTMENLMMKWQGNTPFIFGDKNLDLNQIKVLPLDGDYIIDRLQTQLAEEWNKALTYLGIPNMEIIKRERMLRDEVNRQQGGAFAMQDVRLLARNEACKEINGMFSLNVSVDYNCNMSDDLLKLEAAPQEGEGNNG